MSSIPRLLRLCSSTVYGSLGQQLERATGRLGDRVILDTMTAVTVNNGGRYPAVLITIIVISRERAMWIAKKMEVGAPGLHFLVVR